MILLKVFNQVLEIFIKQRKVMFEINYDNVFIFMWGILHFLLLILFIFLLIILIYIFVSL